MKIFLKKKQFDILDGYLFSKSLRIKVFSICNLQKIQDQYFVRKKSFRKVYYYIKEIGLKDTLLKILSRSREKIRNEKYFSIGIGRVETSESELLKKNQTVCFIAYNHPACSERIVVHENFAFWVDISEMAWISSSKILWLEDFDMEKWWIDFLGWSPYSGEPAKNISMSVQEKITHYWKSICNESKQTVQLNKISTVSEIKQSKNNLKKNKKAVLFGYGNYAKTIILPNLHKKISLHAIHEIDPSQLLPFKSHIHYDVSPFPREIQYDIYFIAGYHHTHTSIAITALKHGADVVIEKPLMTNKQDLEKLIDAMKNSKGELYPCFQRRYQQFNDAIFEDFKLKRGEPISYYAIIYEEVVPPLHWYRWPNSHSAVVSNGCHWIDHFLFLNNFHCVVSYYAKKTKNNEIIIAVELENGATLSLTLSHIGSARIGMQDYIELRSGKNTARIINSKFYKSENENRIIRQKKINKFDSFRKMYQLISENIIQKNAPRISDSVDRVFQVSALVLALDEIIA